MANSRDYSSMLVQEYCYWTVYLHKPQDYLGRLVIWCNREDALDLVDINEGEQREFFLILPKVTEALQIVFQPDLFNYSFLGNVTRHLHCHIVPRYRESRTVNGIIFTDERFGKNWQLNPDFQIPDDVFQEIRSRMKAALEIHSRITLVLNRMSPKNAL